MSLNKIKVKLKFDYLNSLLICYHILNRPTKNIEKNNPSVFKNLKTTILQKISYRRYLHHQKVSSDWSISLYRTKLFSPELKTINQFAEKRKLSQRITKALLKFEPKFKIYFDSLKKELTPIIKMRKRETEKYIDSIYKNAVKITGVKIEIPKIIDIRVIEGMSPSSFGVSVGNTRYIISQKNNIMNKNINIYLLSLIHESISHEIAKQFRSYIIELFGKHIYEVEEGFAKIFALKVFNLILNCESNYYITPGLETKSANIYLKNWHKLTNKNFAKWYYNCLKEIKKSL